jgi:histidine triad (HIT) family protein
MNRVQNVLHPDGFNVGWNHNSVAGQVVPHLHVHIFPRYQGDEGGSMHSIIKNPGTKTVEEVAALFRGS